MAQQKFSNSFREALWETHGKKCFHCTGELLLADMRVDHIVPEHLHHGASDERDVALKAIGLPLDFDIRGNGNFAPSCERCNGQKGGSVLIGRSTAVALTRIQRSLSKLEANLQKRRGDRELEDMLRVVVRSLERGKFSPEEFLLQFRKLIPDAGQRNRVDVKLPTGTVLNWSPNSLVFTDHAKWKMGERRLLPADIAQAVFKGLSEGTATALKHPGHKNQYLISGKNKLKVVFTIHGDRIIVLTAYENWR